jgi:hypothetical protein
MITLLVVPSSSTVPLKVVQLVMVKSGFCCNEYPVEGDGQEIMTLSPERAMASVGAPNVTVKLLALVARPPGAITVIGPEVAPSGTAAVIWLLEFTVKDAFAPLNVTVEAEVKFVPLMTTVVFTRPFVGEKPVMPSAGVPSTLARSTAAMSGGRAVKNAKPVSVSIWLTEVR